MNPLSPDDVCMGIDIESGSPEGRDARYSLVVVKCGGPLLYKAEAASIARLVRVSWEYRPRRLGVDNVFELGGSERRLLKILSLLPPDMEVFQVTLVDGLFLDIREVARRAGILEDMSKTGPLKTAHIAAILACMGYGTSVRSVEEKTVIQVSRLRSPSSGGWSQQRYQRRVRALVQNAATAIKEALDRAGLDYDYYYRESRGGLESAIFTVYAPRGVVEEVVREVRNPDYIVKIRPVYRSKLLIVRDSRDTPGKLVIVGIDPGVTTGVAILDLEGRVLHLESLKAVDRGSIVEIISRYGKPIIVAVDVSDIPESVKKLASQLGATLYTPPHDLSVAEKMGLVERIPSRVEVRDSHERDALAAAYKAYLSLREKLEAIEAKLRDMGADIDGDEVKRWVLEGFTLAEALERAVERILEDLGEGEKRVTVERRAQTIDISGYLTEIEILKAQKEALEAKVKSLEDSLKDYERKLREAYLSVKAEVMRDVEVDKLKSRISTLERELEELREEKRVLEDRLSKLAKLVPRIAGGELILAWKIPILTVKNLKKTEGASPLSKCDVLIVDNPNAFESEALHLLKSLGVKVVLLGDTESPLANALRNMLIPALNVKEYQVEEIQDITLVESRVLKDAERERERLESLRKPPDIEKLIEEYRRERREALKRIKI